MRGWSVFGKGIFALMPGDEVIDGDDIREDGWGIADLAGEQDGLPPREEGVITVHEEGECKNVEQPLSPQGGLDNPIGWWWALWSNFGGCNIEADTFR